MVAAALVRLQALLARDTEREGGGEGEGRWAGAIYQGAMDSQSHTTTHIEKQAPMDQYLHTPLPISLSSIYIYYIIYISVLYTSKKCASCAASAARWRATGEPVCWGTASGSLASWIDRRDTTTGA